MTRTWKYPLLLLLGCLAGCHAEAPQERSLVAVVTSGAGALDVVDVDSGSRVASLSAGTVPHDVAVNRDQGLAVIVDRGSPTRPGRGLILCDLRKPAVLRTVPLKRFLGLHGVQFLPDGHRVAVTAEERRSVLVVDTDSGTLEKVIPTTQHSPEQIVVTSNGERAYVSSPKDGSIAVLNLPRSSLEAVIPVCSDIDGIALSPDGEEIWAACGSANSIAVVSTADLELRETIPCFETPTRVLFIPSDEGDRVVVSNARSGDLAVFSARIRREVMRISLAFTPEERKSRLFDPDLNPAPIGMAADPTTDRLFVTSPNTDLVTVVSLEPGTVSGRYLVGDKPEGIVFARLR